MAQVEVCLWEATNRRLPNVLFSGGLRRSVVGDWNEMEEKKGKIQFRTRQDQNFKMWDFDFVHKNPNLATGSM